MESVCDLCPGNCRIQQEDAKLNPRREIWRLRLNWLFLIIIGSLYAISYTAISSSFHQFMTNPKANDLRNTTAFEKIEPGLGQSEVFYSWVITLFNIGALIGGFGSGCLVKFIPYWHLVLFSLVLHTIGYVLYAISNEGWLIIISKLFSGYFIGAELTLALSYFAESSIDYQSTMKKLGKTVESSEAIRNNLFALHNVGVNIGYFLGPGAAAVFAQFQIDLFRSIAWYNVAFGVAFILLQLVLFHGESTCKTAKRCQLCHSKSCTINKTSVMEIFILSFLILCRGVLSFRFGAYETIYNPVLSDYFGLTERDSSYFFLGLVIAQTAGTLLLLIFQHLKLNSRNIAIIGLLMTMISFILMADWQSIPYDPCTDLSPHHHPDLISVYNEVHLSGEPYEKTGMTNRRAVNCVKMYQTGFDPIMLITVKLAVFQMPVSPEEIKWHCTDVDTCSGYCDDNSDLCLHYTFDDKLCIQGRTFTEEYSADTQAYNIMSDKTASHYICRQGLSGPSTCITTYKASHSANELMDKLAEELANEKEGFDIVHSQTFQMLQVDVYAIAVNRCETATVHGHQCYWIPNSIITHHHCTDCPPICRSLQRSLTFPQFCIGAALLMVSIPIAWVPVAALISDRVHREAQGLVMGVIVALTAIGRSISPLWLDAAYEGLMKRTFIAMLVLMASHLPFLIGIVILYRKLGSKPMESAFTDLEEDEVESETDAGDKELDNFPLICESDTCSPE